MLQDPASSTSYPDPDEALQIFPFVSDNKKLEFERISTISDLQEILKVLGDTVERKYDNDKRIWEILKMCEYENPVRFIGDNLFSISGDEQTLCIKIMLIIELEENTKNFELFFPFLCYLEEKILPEIITVAKRLKNEIKQGSLKLFETGVNKIEKWQLVILYIYIGQDEYNICFTNICFMMTIFFKYLIEKKEAFNNENPGTEWNAIEHKLLIDQTKAWDSYLCGMSTYSFDSKIINSQVYIKDYIHNILNCNQTLIYCIYSVLDTVDISSQIIVYEGSLYELLNLMKSDYQDIIGLDDCDIITDGKSKNYGKFVWTIKLKLLKTITYIVKRTEDMDEILTIAKSTVVVHFKQFLLSQMEQGGNYSGISLKEVAFQTSLSVVNNMNGDIVIPDFKEMVLDILQMWKSHFISITNYNSTFIEQLDTILEEYFKSVENPKVFLLVEIINKCAASIDNFRKYCDLLILAMKRTQRIKENIRSSFRTLVFKVFETLDTMEYLNDVDVSEKEKMTIHTENTKKCYKIIAKFYLTLEIMNLDKILTRIRKNTEEILMKNHLPNDSLLSNILITTSKILRDSEYNLLSTTLKELDYYPFLTELIRKVMSSVTIEHELLEHLTKLIGTITFNGMISHCPFNAMQSYEEGKSLLYDYILPYIFDSIANKKESRTCGPSLIVYGKFYWILCLSVSYDVSNSGSGRLLSILDLHIDTIVKDFKNSSYSYSVQDEVYEMLMLMILYSRHRLEMIPIIAENMHLVESVPFKREMYHFEFFTYFEVIEYLIDNQLISEHFLYSGWDTFEYTLSDLPIFLKIQCSKVLHKIKL